MSAKILNMNDQMQSEIACIERRMDGAIALADEIIAIADEENRRLATGRPVSLQDLLDRKRVLVQEFSTFFSTFKNERDVFILAPQDKFDKLQDRVQTLAQAMFDNAESLTRAANANERRLDAIMRAIRQSQKVVQAVGYGANGQQPSYGSQSISTKAGVKV